MTISKKFVTMAVFALGMQTVAQAYDVVGLKNEVAQILKHTEENCIWGYSTASWIKNKINRTYMTSNSEIITLARILNDKDNLAQKTDALFTLMQAEKQQRVAIEEFMSTVSVCLCIAAASIIIGDEIYRNVINKIKRHDLYLKYDILDNVQKMIDQKMTFPDVLLWS